MRTRQGTPWWNLRTQGPRNNRRGQGAVWVPVQVRFADPTRGQLEQRVDDQKARPAAQKPRTRCIRGLRNLGVRYPSSQKEWGEATRLKRRLKD